MKVVVFALASLAIASGKTNKRGRGKNGKEKTSVPVVQLGPRPYFLVDSMSPSFLKDDLEKCAAEMTSFKHSDFSIGHRGAAMQFPEHTVRSWKAAGTMGAGIIECDVIFTKDLELVCRHDQCDLHTTTDIVTRPDLNAKCTTPWAPGVAPRCCTSDFTLAEIRTLCAKMDSSFASGATPQAYAFGGTADWRTDLYQSIGECARVSTHAEYIELIKSRGGKFTPELKTPVINMPFNGYTQEDYAQQMIDEYIAAGVPPSDVWPQSFYTPDIYYWIDNTAYGKQAVALDGEYDRTDAEVEAFLDELVAGGANIVAPPMNRLVEGAPGTELKIVASHYAKAAKERGVDIITWTLERTGPGLTGFYWQTVNAAGIPLKDGDMFNLLYVLAYDVGILGIFSDWPATVTFFANCMGL